MMMTWYFTKKIAFCFPVEGNEEKCFNVSANIKQEFDEVSHSHILEETDEINVNKAESNANCTDTIEIPIEVTHVSPTSLGDKCDYKAKQKSNPKVHIERHIELNDESLASSSCGKCDYKANQISNFKGYIKTT